jgi:Bax protein
MWQSISAHRTRVLLAGGSVAALILLGLVAMGGDGRAPDFRDYPAGEPRKQAFLTYTRPIIESENDRIRRDRERLAAIAADGRIGWLDRRWLTVLARSYDLDTSELSGMRLVEALLMRVDIVPASLALAQAAKESGWGTSRFAREGRNWFGEWCFEPGCGMVPASRAAGATHEVAVFGSTRDSVASYLHNINTHPGYDELRADRAVQRAAGEPLSGLRLARHLSRYSARGEAYVREVRQLIRYNRLEGG